MIALQSVYANGTGTHPDFLAIDSTGAATPDGTEFIAAGINNESFGWIQALMNWANGGTNAPGAVGVPSGVTEASGVSQILDATQKGHGIGPGFSSVRYINDSPATHGDRSLILAEQGVLIASYPDLDAACWITGDTAAQEAAAAAGEKFYRSSDSAGATGDAAGPYLQLPAQPTPSFLKQYEGNIAGTLDFQVTFATATGVSLKRAVLIPYKTLEGAYRLIGNVVATHNAGTDSTFSISGLTFKNTASYNQHVPCISFNQITLGWSFTSPGTNGILITFAAGTNTGIRCSFNVELDSWPTWADDFEMPWAITY